MRCFYIALFVFLCGCRFESDKNLHVGFDVFSPSAALGVGKLAFRSDLDDAEELSGSSDNDGGSYLLVYSDEEITTVGRIYDSGASDETTVIDLIAKPSGLTDGVYYAVHIDEMGNGKQKYTYYLFALLSDGLFWIQPNKVTEVRSRTELIEQSRSLLQSRQHWTAWTELSTRETNRLFSQRRN